jgi:regulator of sigma E protease
MLEILYTTFQIIFWFIFILVPLVAVHEFGHLIFSRLFGVKIPEFGIGLPLTNHKLTKKYKGINWSLYPWLLGGFVRIYGDHDVLDDFYELAKIDPIKAKSEYSDARLYEILNQNTLEDLLKDNFIDFDENWNWFSKIKYFEKEAQETDLKHLLAPLKNTKPDFLSNFSQNNITNYSNLKELKEKLDPEEFKNLTTTILNEYNRLKNLAKTLIDWEYDSKIVNKNSKALKEAFFAKNIFAQFFIIAGGVVFNILLAVILFMVSLGVIGTIPEVINLNREVIFADQINEYSKNYNVKVLSKGLSVTPIEGSPLIGAGIKERDEIFVIAGRNIEEEKFRNLDDLTYFLNQYEDKNIEIKYYRPSTNEEKTTNVTLKKDSERNRVLLKSYVGYKVQRFSKGFFNILPDAIIETNNIIGATFKGLGELIQALLPQTQDRSALSTVTGPIGIGYISGTIFNIAGLPGIIYLIALISIALAVFNMLPIPALDGGRLVILILGKLSKKRFKKFESWAISITFVLLMILGLMIAGLDIQRIINR